MDRLGDGDAGRGIAVCGGGSGGGSRSARWGMTGGEVSKGEEGEMAEATMAFRWRCVLILAVRAVAVERSGSSTWSVAAAGLAS
jgi:hypothetical protein